MGLFFSIESWYSVLINDEYIFMILLYIIGFSLLDGLAGVLSAFFVIFKLSKNKNIIQHLVTFAAGIMFAAALLDLIPEAITESGNIRQIMVFVMAGIIIFYILEKFLLWSHCHNEVCKTHQVTARLLMIGDTIHNCLDGAAVAAAFLVSIPLGIVTAVAIFFHEVPQEMGDIGILLYLGYTRKKALIFNAISGIIGILSAAAIYFIGTRFNFNPAGLLAITAGGFIYIAGVDLLPEAHRGLNRHNLVTHTIIFIGGIAIFWFVNMILRAD